MAVVRNPKTGKIVAKKFSLAKLERAAEEFSGFCLACGAERGCTDPDARRYDCERCGLNYVYGAEELVLMGRVKGEA